MLSRAILLGSLFLVFSGAVATAAPADYCAAYARDFADAGEREEAVWKKRFANAEASCLVQFSPREATAAPAPLQESPTPVMKRQPEPKAPVKLAEEPPPKIDKKVKAKQQTVAAAPKPRPVAKPESKTQAKPRKVAEPAAGIYETDIAEPATAEVQEPEKKRSTIFDLVKPRVSDIKILSSGNAKKKGKLVPGSSAWLDYCERKYASFNRDTGTYTSFSGEERKCLVTSN